MVIVQQKALKLFSKQSPYDRDIVTDMKTLLQYCSLVSPSIFKNHYYNF